MEIVDKPVLLTPYSNILKNPTYFPASATTFVTGGYVGNKNTKKSRKQRKNKSRKQKKNKSRKQRK